MTDHIYTTHASPWQQDSYTPPEYSSYKIEGYCIYMHTSPSGKSYIGQTNNIRNRQASHKTAKNGCVKLSNAIKKYGWDGLTHTILIDGLSLDEANDAEKYYINLYNTLHPNGYNLSQGGKSRLVSEETRKKLASNNDIFIPKAIQTHGEKYDYSNVVYINSKTKIDIICRQHGIFQQTPTNHVHGAGCPKCGTIAASTLQASDTYDFITKATHKHGEKYDYSKVVYINSKTKVDIICKEHGLFKQTPKDHLNGCACPDCGSLVRTISNSGSKEDFITKATHKHGEKYDYSKVVYINSKTKVDIICKEHGPFKQIPNSHLTGRGCPNCGDKNKGIRKLL